MKTSAASFDNETGRDDAEHWHSEFIHETHWHKKKCLIARIQGFSWQQVNHLKNEEILERNCTTNL